MARSRLTHRLAALGLLVGALAGATASAWWALASYTAGQREIVDKRAALRNLRDLADARSAFAHLLPKGKAQGLIVSADAEAEAALSAAVTHAAEGQQVIVDGVEPLAPEPVMRVAAVHLRGTQAGIYGFLRVVEDQVPYLLVPRLELTPSRAADPEHGKPFVIAADLRLALVVAPAIPGHKPPAPAEAAP